MTHLDRRGFLLQSGGSIAAIALRPDLDTMGPRRLSEPKAIGVVGIGRHGRAILADLAKIDGAKVVAICDNNPARAKAGQERSVGAEAFTDHRAMLDKRLDLDAVIVATPTHLHRPIVEAALAANKHVYCEAPLAHTIEDARAIAAAAEAAPSRVFMAGFQGRSNPVYQLARTFYGTDAFRDFVGGSAHFHRKTSWRFPTDNWRLDPTLSLGLIGEIGAQQLDVIHWFRKQTPVAVAGMGSIAFHRDGRTVPDTVSAQFQFADNSVVTYEASLANSFGNQHEILRGTNGTFSLSWTHGWMFKEVDSTTLGWEVYALRQQFHQDEGIILIADATKLAAQGQLKAGIGLPYSPLYYALADFLRSVSFPNVPVACNAKEGLKATIIGIKANQAVVGRTSVSIDL